MHASRQSSLKRHGPSAVSLSSQRLGEGSATSEHPSTLPDEQALV